MSTDFSSIDKLVEFGMGMAVAQQMISTMNSAMNNMQVAGVNAGTTGQSGTASPAAVSKTWYAVINDRQVGPLNQGDLSTLIQNSNITDATLMWCPGMSGWQLASNIPEVYKLFLLNGK